MSQDTSTNLTAKKQNRRRLGVGIFLLIEAFFLFLLLLDSNGKFSTFVLTSKVGGVEVYAPDLVIPPGSQSWSSPLLPQRWQCCSL